MEQRVLAEVGSREQMAAIMRQRFERNHQRVGLRREEGPDPLRALFAIIRQGGAADQPPARLPWVGPRAPKMLGQDHGPAAFAGISRQPPVPREDEEEQPSVKTALNVTVDGDLVSYCHNPCQPSRVGLFVSGKRLKPESNYFEIEIINGGFSISHNIAIGLVSEKFSPDIPLCSQSVSVAYHTGEGNLYCREFSGVAFGPKCNLGDRIGCGIRFPPPSTAKSATPSSGSGGDDALSRVSVQVFFTLNGTELQLPPATSAAATLSGASLPTTMNFILPVGGFFPAVSMLQAGEEVSIRMMSSDQRPLAVVEDMMLVDSAEDEWLRLHDIRINGPVLEYVGQGKSLYDVGLAQAKTPICTRNHYFEIEIVDPGNHCFIAIGLARKDYPMDRHPGWNKGSIAYHADDGKVFVGSGQGAPFGPKCHKGDIMGCGVLFPRSYECKSDSEEEIEQQEQGGLRSQYGSKGSAGEVARVRREDEAVVDDQAPPPPGPDALVPGDGGNEPDHDYFQIGYTSDSGEDDNWWNDRNYTQNGVQVEIYFTRNGNVVGRKDIRIPKGGFYPTVGMMSCDEKVRVDLRPLSG